MRERRKEKERTGGRRRGRHSVFKGCKDGRMEGRQEGTDTVDQKKFGEKCRYSKNRSSKECQLS